jgi:nucleotide-binding universal stress UspA family protein
VTVHEGTDRQEGHPDLETLARECEGEVGVRVERGRRASEEIGRVAVEEEEATLILMGRRGRGASWADSLAPPRSTCPSRWAALYLVVP